MPTAKKTFDFEDYAKQQFEDIKDILKNLNSAFVPREEVMLMHNQTQAIITSLSTTVTALLADVAHLKTVAARNQGAALSRRELLAWIVAAAGILSAMWWVPGVIHK